MSDPYSVLGVGKDATPAQIKKAFRKKASENHSDKNGGDDTAMAAINMAYKLLSNPEKRKRYDETGDDGIYTHTIEEQAVNVIMMLASQIIEKAPEHVGIVAEITKALKRAEQECTQTIAEKKRSIAKFERRSKTVKAKKNNLLQGLFQQHIDQLKQTIAALENNIKINAAALQIIKDGGYEDVLFQESGFMNVSASSGLRSGRVFSDFFKEV